MMKYAFTFFFFCLLSCKNETSKPVENIPVPDGFHLMIKTGLPEIETTNQINFLAKKYHVRFYNVGCVIEKSRLDSINKINDSISLVVQTKYGSNWLRNLRAELDTANKVREIAYIEMLSRKNDYTEPYYYLVIPGIRKNEYLVNVYSINYENNKSQIYNHYNFGVDFEKKLVLEIPKSYTH